MRPILSLLLAASLLAPAVPALAQDKWPSKPIEILYPYPPGNDADAVMRLVAEGMSKRLGVPVQVINKPGGGGVVGTTEMVKSRPDGYTIGSWTPGPGITQVLAGNTPYKQADIQPLAGLFVSNFVLAGRGDIPAKNLKELAAWAKGSGKRVIIGSYGPAAVPALIAARIAKQDGWNYKVVTFSNPGAKELTAGDADLTTTGAEMVAPFVKTGQVKVLSTWLPTRSDVFPDVATAKESGHGDLYAWTGLAAPAGVPADIAEKLSQAAREALKDKPVVELLAKLSLPALPMNRQEMARQIEKDSRWMGELMNEIGMSRK